MSFHTPTPWPQLTTADRVTAVTALDDQGLSKSEIAYRLGATRQNISALVFSQRLKLKVRPNQPPRRSLVPELPEDPAVWVATAGAVHIEQHRNSQCRWPVGDPAARTFCAGHRVRGSYCAQHAAIAYRPRPGDVAYSKEIMSAGRPVAAGVTIEEAVAVVRPESKRKGSAE